MPFKDLDELARKDETPGERIYHDRRRAEFRGPKRGGDCPVARQAPTAHLVVIPPADG